jgi:hypothetical protein
VPFYPLETELVDGGLYLTGVPPADRTALGARVVAVGGHPVASVLDGIGSLVDYQDPGMLAFWDTNYIRSADLLQWLGITSSAAAAAYTVETTAGTERTVRIGAVTSWPDMATVPIPLYQQDNGAPYWMKVLPDQDAVYLKYNQCLSTTGFQQLAARALAILASHPGYRLIVDLRDNGGGDSAPFQSLVSGITANSAINRQGRVFGLVNGYTDSSATVDAQNLKTGTNAILIGTPPADPVDEWGNDASFQLPHSHVVIGYTTAVINATRQDWGMPRITVAPTPAQVMAGQDPVLAAALSYGRPG